MSSARWVVLQAGSVRIFDGGHAFEAGDVLRHATAAASGHEDVNISPDSARGRYRIEGRALQRCIVVLCNDKRRHGRSSFR